VHNCGYGGAVGAFAQMAANFGAELSEEDALRAVKAWRAANPRIVSWWYELEDAARNAVKRPGKAFRARSVSFKVVGSWLLCRLPSGRLLPYYGAKCSADGTLRYEGIELGKWTTIDTFGGKLAENITQAVSRDILAYNMPLVEEEGSSVIGPVHDEIVTEVDEDVGAPETLETAMGHVPPWGEGLPLAVAAWQGERYRK